jgi:hypothetical protein
MDLKKGDVRCKDKANGVRLIVSMSDKRAAKDEAMRKKGLQRLEKRFQSGKLTKANVNNHGYNKYLKMDGDVSVSIDMDKFNADAAWDGIKGYVTNTKVRPV